MGGEDSENCVTSTMSRKERALRMLANTLAYASVVALVAGFAGVLYLCSAVAIWGPEIDFIDDKWYVYFTFGASAIGILGSGSVVALEAKCKTLAIRRYRETY